MKPGIPWSVKGIEPETREAAKFAARRSGMTLGEWLNTMILDSAEGAEPEPMPMARHQRPTASRDETSIRLEDIAEQLSRIARREQDTAPARATYSPESRSEDTETLSKILNRVESNERQTVEAFTAVNERLAVLGRQMAQTAKAMTSANPDESGAFKSMETAVRNIVEHIEVSEKRTRDTLKSMQDRMGEMAQRATASNSEQVVQSAPAFTQLETRLSDLADRVERSETKIDFALPEIVRKELSLLAERIETVRESSEVLASKAQTAAVQTSQAELREIEKRILNLLKEAQTAFNNNGGSNAEMQRLRGEIGSLNQRIDSARTDTASERDVHALRVAVEQLSTRVAQGPDMRPLADMDKRLVEIAQRIEQDQHVVRNSPQLGELERRMAELDHRLEDAIRLQGDGYAQTALEQKISEVADRVGRTEHQLSHLETIERAINQLFESVEQSRHWAKDVAEEAANRMADRLMNAPAAAPLAIASSPELQALEDGLKAVRESAVGADKRNQETLEAVHETLEQIVEKLAELEMAAVGQKVAAAAFQGNPAPVSGDAGQWDAQSEAVDNSGAAASQDSPPQQSVIPESNDNPGEDTPVANDSNPMADWLAESKIPSYPDFNAADNAEGETQPDDFIAAARRATQAASQKGILGSIAPGAAKPGKATEKKRGLRLPFMKGPAGKPALVHSEEKLPPAIKPAANSNKSNRRTLVLAGLVLLVAVSAFTINMLAKAQKPAPAIAPAMIEGTVKPAQQSLNDAPAPGSVKTADDILTGSLSVPADSTISSIIADPGFAAVQGEMLASAVGSDALREAAENGDAAAQFIVATRFLDGDGIAQDVTKAAHWYQKSASAGLAPAQYRLATLFERGQGVPQDAASALVWYERAAEQGNVKAMHNAAVIAAGTAAGKPDYDVAYKWFLAASQNGLKDSQFNLAVLYERGLGTKPNPGEALFWYTIAAGQNDADAQKRATVLQQGLSPALTASIGAKAKAWVPLQAPASANVVTIQDPAWQNAPVQSQNEQVQPKTVNAAQAIDPIGITQELLTRLGFNVGKPDGKMSARTANAIRLFQLQSGLVVTGEVNQDLISQLQAKLG